MVAAVSLASMRELDTGATDTDALARGHIAMPSFADAPWVVIVGAGGLTAHYCTARALIASASAVSGKEKRRKKRPVLRS